MLMSMFVFTDANSYAFAYDYAYIPSENQEKP